eukprot:5695020-Amphidinium_carterae.1
MAIELVGAPWGFDCNILAISMVLVFGWVGAPGQYMAWAWALKLHHAAHQPPYPEVHDSPAYSSKVLMDDCVLVEPDLGMRPYTSEA